MNNCDQIHETVIRDVIELIDDASKSVDNWKKIANKETSKSIKSIASASSNLVLVFPVACSRGIDIGNASMISKAMERKCVSMLQMLFSAYQLSDANDAVEYLSQFHKNIKMNNNFGIDDLLDISDKLGVQLNSTDMGRSALNAIREDMKNINFVLPENIQEGSLNNYKVYNGSANGIRVIKEAKSDEANFVRDNKDMYQAAKAASDIIQNQVLDSDVKKANELIPTSMLINIYHKDADTNTVTQIGNIVIGVKCKLYPLDSEDIINRIKLKSSDRNSLTSLLRATTREISFWKDFVFAIDRAKLDALSLSRRGSSNKLWKVLERRSLHSKFKRAFGANNDATAITTLVVSQEEVEYIKRMDNLDLEKLSICRPLMESLNLMGFVIVDESMEVAKFLLDTGDDMFETVSFTHLERESSDNTYKKVVTLMTKMSR